jgi:hypothetical protein
MALAMSARHKGEKRRLQLGIVIEDWGQQPPLHLVNVRLDTARKLNGNPCHALDQLRYECTALKVPMPVLVRQHIRGLLKHSCQKPIVLGRRANNLLGNLFHRCAFPAEGGELSVCETTIAKTMWRLAKKPR